MKQMREEMREDYAYAKKEERNIMPTRKKKRETLKRPLKRPLSIAKHQAIAKAIAKDLLTPSD
ncbi:hypothetical protein AB6D20_027640 (plasmid) [Vibrio splendidus]